MRLKNVITCTRWRARSLISAAAILMLAQQAHAEGRIGSIGDWQTWTDTFLKPFAVVDLPSTGPYGVRSLSMKCDKSGKINFELFYVAMKIASKLIVDNPNLDTFVLDDDVGGNHAAIAAADADRFLNLLLKEEVAANAAGAKSWTLVFFLDDPKTRGYSANIGGVRQVRDYLVKSCAASDAAREKAAKSSNQRCAGLYLTE